MKLGLINGGFGPVIQLDIESIRAAESMGYESVWTAEAYGSDAVTTATWILANTTRIHAGTAIMQMPARTPACTAMTALTLNQLSGGRFRLGLGASGPQVAEGWHGQAYGRPVTRIKEYIEIVRKIFAREAPVTHEGFHYSLPYAGADGTGLGKPLKCILRADTEIPIYTASITPKGLAGSAEVADGVFPIWMNPSRFDVLEPSISAGLAKAGKSMLDYDISPFVTVAMGDDLDRCRMPIKGNMALYIGGMGAREKNFYNDYARSFGFEDAAVKVQDLFLAGRKDEAMAAVPDELVDAVHLVGPAGRIRERLSAWKEAGAKGHVGTMLIGTGNSEALELIASEML